MPEATRYQECDDVRDYTADAALTAGEVLQLRDGRAAVIPVATASGDGVGAQTEGIFKVLKTASIVILDGGDVSWDHSANTATYNQVSDRDFFLGTAVGDAAASDAYVYVNLNKRASYKIDLIDSAFASVLVGTAAAGAFGYPARLGATAVLELSATNEAQKVDLLSIQGFAPGANPIVEVSFRVLNDGSGTTPDLSLGIADGTHASDADSIAQSVFFHLDGNTTTINAECDDGTNETAATTTATTYTEGSTLACRVEGWIDARDLSSVKFYVNGAGVASGTTFSIAAASGTLFLLAHLEKTIGTDVYRVAVDKFRVRTGQQ